MISTKGLTAIHVTGNNTVTSPASNGGSYGIFVFGGDLTINGSGTLAVTGGNEGAEGASSGVFVFGGDLTIDGSATLTATGWTAGAGDSFSIAATNITINKDATVTATGGTAGKDSFGVLAQGDVTVNGKLTATGDSFGVLAGEYQEENNSFTPCTVTIGENAAVTATGGKQAIYGTVKNALSGTGWTDVDGTTGKAAIAVNNAGAEMTYEKVKFPAEQDPVYSGGGSYTLTTINIPVSSEGKDAATVNVTVQLSSSTAIITSANVDKVLEAKEAGNITVDLSSLSSSVNEVSLPAELVKNVADAVADKDKDVSGLEIKLPTGSITFDAKALATITKQAGGKDVKLHLNNVPQATLTSAQQETVKEMTNAKVVDVYLTADGKLITDFSGGIATIGVPYTLKDGQVAEGVVGWYVGENGSKTKVPCTYDGKNANIGVPHFSNYVIAYDAAKAAEPDPEPQPEPTPGPATPTDIGYDDLSDKEKKNADAVASALGVDKDTAAQMVKKAAELGVSVDTLKLGTETILAVKDDADPKGTDFGKLTARVTKRTNSALTLRWAKQKNADGYLVYGAKSGSKYKLLMTVKKNKTVSFTQKKLKKGTYYKYIVVAYKNVNGQQMPIAASVVIHTPTKGGKTTVAKSVKLSKTEVSVKKGKSVTVKATEVPEEKKLKNKTHRAVKFESSDKSIATVNAKGKITGKKKGKATIYAYAQNGIYKTVKVTVK